MSLPNSSAQNAISKDKQLDCLAAGQAVVHLVQKNICPKDIMTRKAFLNAITVVTALGGSTNAVLHLLAMAHAIGVKLSLDDFTRVGKKVPVLADLATERPVHDVRIDRNRRYSALDAHAAGPGAAARGLPDGHGQTLRQNLRGIKRYPKSQDIVRSLLTPIKKDGHLVILYGTLHLKGPWQDSGKEGLHFTGKARIFPLGGEGAGKDPRRRCQERGCGGDPLRRAERRPGHARDAVADLGHHGQGAGQGRGPDHGWSLLGRQPRLRGRPHHPGSRCRRALALLKNGDVITIDAEKREINVKLSKKELGQRKRQWRPPSPLFKRGLAKYARQVRSASNGATTD